MSLQRSQQWKRGGICRNNLNGFLSPTLTVKDPSIPNLPLNTPAVGGYFGILKRWSGSAWVNEPLKRWNGSSWVAAVLKRWNGSSWVTVDTTGV